MDRPESSTRLILTTGTPSMIDVQGCAFNPTEAFVDFDGEGVCEWFSLRADTGGPYVPRHYTWDKDNLNDAPEWVHRLIDYAAKERARS